MVLFASLREVINVHMILAPEAANGWPNATAPPLLLTMLWSRFRSFMLTIAIELKFSLISHKSMLFGISPALVSAIFIDPAGAVPK